MQCEGPHLPSKAYPASQINHCAVWCSQFELQASLGELTSATPRKQQTHGRIASVAQELFRGRSSRRNHTAHVFDNLQLVTNQSIGYRLHEVRIEILRDDRSNGVTDMQVVAHTC